MDMVFEYLNMTRIYTKPKGQMPDYEAPVIIRGNVKPTVRLVLLERPCDLVTFLGGQMVGGEFLSCPRLRDATLLAGIFQALYPDRSLTPRRLRSSAKRFIGS